MKKILGIIIVVILLVGGWYFLTQQEEAEEIRVPLDQEVVIDEEGPYEEAETVVPMDPRNETMHETFELVLGEIFEKEPKLINSGDVLALAYIVDRVITPNDVSEVRDLLGEAGYELEGTRTEEDLYELHLSAEILGQEYRGNIHVEFYLTEEGEKAQIIKILVL